MQDREIADKILEHFENRLQRHEDLDYEVYPSVLYNDVYVAVVLGEHVIWNNQDENDWPENSDVSDEEVIAMQIASAEVRVRAIITGLQLLLDP